MSASGISDLDKRRRTLFQLRNGQLSRRLCEVAENQRTRDDDRHQRCGEDARHNATFPIHVALSIVAFVALLDGNTS